MGHAAAPLSVRIRAAFEQARRPLTCSEISGYWINQLDWPAVRAEVERMVESGELVDLGTYPRPSGDCRRELGPYRIYGLAGVIYGTPARR